MPTRSSAMISRASVFPRAPAWVPGGQALWEAAVRKASKRRVPGPSERSTEARSEGANPNHHLWRNNGIWFMHCTVYPSRCTKERLRYSLGTRVVRIARRRRDAVLAVLDERGLLSTHGHARVFFPAVEKPSARRSPEHR